MINIITGIYGAGKTEFCVNYALSLEKPVKLADLDIVNPYFRSRDKAVFLAEKGVTIIGNLTENTTNQDVPAISGEVTRAILAKDRLVIDLAGDAPGLHALSLFKERLVHGKYEMWAVVNVFRPENTICGKVMSFVKAAEERSGLRITGLVNNSHLLKETTAREILHGQEIVLQASKNLNIPVKYTFLREEIYEEINVKLISPALTFKKAIMREEWQ